MPHELPKAYDPAQIESHWAQYWVREKLFHVETPALSGEARPVFTLLLPPPNVTGRLHMGHMLNQTEMDIIVRWHRMRGRLSLWLPGTDHAGIATQMMVERQLAKEGKNRRDMGREAFIARVWQWREQYGGAILEQMKRLGASVDWGREYFTMDERLSRAVREAFVRLWEDGLIYRGNYIVNWCPRCATAISDLETIHEETPGKLYQIRYPVIGANEFITVATTRPETMLGDTAVAVNPRDPRYKHLHGKAVRLPLMEREIPIILDEVAQPEFGTGAVKVTPAHDPNDFQAGLRNKLPQIAVMDEYGRMNENAGRYAGLDRYEAREHVLGDLEKQGFLVGTKDYVVPLGKCDRCKTIVEPRLSTQWFVAVNAKPKQGGLSLAAKAIEVAKNGEVRFVPDNYRQIYLNWMENIHDWCISRQLWWGHRIPAWHCLDCKQITVARDVPAKCANCGGTQLEQDPDVLDTWFSSGLLPMSALGWPDKTRDLEVFFPTTLLITGFDILFFWVARMIMLNGHFMSGHRQDEAVTQVSAENRGANLGHPANLGRHDDSVPFRNVYIHGLVRDAERQKMSKTKGNVLDPIEVIDRYGTDATRFTLASMASPGTDIAFNEARVEGYRAFANKIWNAARFMFMNVDKLAEAGVWSLKDFGGACALTANGTPDCGLPAFRAETLEDRWILSRFNRVAQEVDRALTSYRYDEAANSVYSFFWGEFCDWYIELVKPRIVPEHPAATTAAANLVTLFEAALRLLSPIMPFITEEIWHAIYDGKPPVRSIALVAYPTANEFQIDMAAETEMAVLQDLIVSVRNIRAELKIEPRLRVPIQVHSDDGVRGLVDQNRGALERLANVEQVEFVAQSLAKESGARSTARFDVRVVFEQKIDVAAERERLTKELTKIEKEMANAERQLANEQFLAKAPAHVVEGLRKRLGELKVLEAKNRSALEGLKP
ncbi:MAG: valine--tRNA ligase [Terriglobales bacterium]